MFLLNRIIYHLFTFTLRMIIPTPGTYQPTIEDFKKAAQRIQGVAIRTQLIPLRYYDEDPMILLKPEMLQPIGSYKIRGVYNWVKKLSPEQRAKGISTASSGNMAQAVAYTAKLFNIPASARSLPEAVPLDPQLEDGSVYGKNSWRWLGYGGPCPPSGTHRYVFTIYALDSMLDLPVGITADELKQAIDGHVRGQAELIGTYTR